MLDHKRIAPLLKSFDIKTFFIEELDRDHEKGADMNGVVDQIDQIDQVLAKHSGFTDEELDFIINYDSKYRMGRNADSGESEKKERRQAFD
jgi:hypothetical protein